MASAYTSSVITSSSSFPSAHFAGPKSNPQQAPSRVHFRAPLRVTASACASSTAERTRAQPRAATTPASSLYEVLGIQAGATCQEIKAAYRRLARVLHPDVSGERDDDEFIRLHEAYATLSDPAKRADYDRSLFWRGMSSSPFVMTASTVTSMAGSASGFSGYTSRRWETDQCW